LVDIDLLSQCCCVVAAQIPTTVRCDADAKVTNPNLQLGIADYVGDCGCDAWVDLDRTVRWCVGFVVETDKEDSGNEG